MTLTLSSISAPPAPRTARVARAAILALLTLALGATTVLAHPALGGPVDPAVTTAAVPTALPAGVDLSAYALVIILVFALIGFSRGVAREGRVLLVAIVSYFAFGSAWSKFADFLNKNIKLAYAGYKMSTSSEDPGAVYKAVSAMDPVVPADGAHLAVWQIAFYVVVVLLFGYGILGRIGPRFNPGQSPARAIPRFIDRVVGALVGGLAGLITAMFILPRVVPGARISLIDTRLSIAAAAAPYKHWILFAVVVALLVFGVKSLGSSTPRQKVYN